MFPEGSLEDPMRYLFGPGPDEVSCMALTPECMGLFPFLASQIGFGS